MRLDLHKKRSSVYLQYEHVSDEIGAEGFKAENRDEAVVLAFTLRPVDSNQSTDEERLASDDLREVLVLDELTTERFVRFLKRQKSIAQTHFIEITSRGKTICLPVAFRINDQGFLQLIVQRQVG